MNRFLAYIDTKFKELKLKLKAFSLFLFIVNMYRYSIDYTQETLRTFSLYIIKILGLKFNFNIIFNRVLVFLNQRLLFFFVKYIMTFFFIIWLLFEMFFLRFYLVTTPTDSQISIDRKEIHEGYSRFLPVMFTETLMFFSRPNRRVFRILWLVFANLKAIVWLIEIVYFEDIRFILNKFFYFFFKFLHIIFFFLSFFFKFIFVGVVFLYDVIYFFFKLRVVKLLKLLFFFFLLFGFFAFFYVKTNYEILFFGFTKVFFIFNYFFVF